MFIKKTNLYVRSTGYVTREGDFFIARRALISTRGEACTSDIVIYGGFETTNLGGNRAFIANGYCCVKAQEQIESHPCIWGPRNKYYRLGHKFWLFDEAIEGGVDAAVALLPNTFSEDKREQKALIEAADTPTVRKFVEGYFKIEETHYMRPLRTAWQTQT